MNPTSATPLDPITELLPTYTDLNSLQIKELAEVPSALEFMRYAARNRPFVARGGAEEWKATRTWDVSTLRGLLEGQSVNVAITPHR
jgi:jumonji domain-containing protein 7